MKILRNILKGASFSAALFVFEACYGTPPVRTDIVDDAEVVADDETIAEAGEIATIAEDGAVADNAATFVTEDSAAE